MEKKNLCLSWLLKERKCLYEIVDIFIKFVEKIKEVYSICNSILTHDLYYCWKLTQCFVYSCPILFLKKFLNYKGTYVFFYYY